MQPYALLAGAAVGDCVLKNAKSIMPEQDLLSIDVEGEFRRMSEANCQDGGALPQLNRDCQQLDSFASEGVLVEADIPFLQVAAQKLHGRRPRSLSSGVGLGA